MKKVLLFVIIISLVFFAGCGNDGTNNLCIKLSNMNEGSGTVYLDGEGFCVMEQQNYTFSKSYICEGFYSTYNIKLNLVNLTQLNNVMADENKCVLLQQIGE